MAIAGRGSLIIALLIGRLPLVLSTAMREAIGTTRERCLIITQKTCKVDEDCLYPGELSPAPQGSLRSPPRSPPAPWRFRGMAWAWEVFDRRHAVLGWLGKELHELEHLLRHLV